MAASSLSLRRQASSLKSPSAAPSGGVGSSPVEVSPSDGFDAPAGNTQSKSFLLLKRVGWGAFTVVLLALVMVMHGLVPGRFFPALGASLTIMAQAQSLAIGNLWSYPVHSGYPLGAPVLLDLPLVYTQAILMRLTSLNTLHAFVIAHWLFLGVAFFGCRELFRQFNIQPVLASIGAALYLTSIFILGHQGFSPLMLGFALLPLTVLLDVMLRDAVVSVPLSRRRMFTLAISCVIWRTMLLFIDGYTFVISATFALSLWLFALQRSRGPHRWPLQLAYATAVGMSFATPYSLYKLYVPRGAAYATMPADFFRAQGVDVATLLLPFNDATQLATLLRWRLHYNGLQFFGDGTNAFYNYLGVALLLAIAGAIYTWRCNRSLFPLVFAGVLCLVLSIGPSLKFYTLREINAPKAQIVFSDYLMSPDKALVNLHTDSFYTRMPGVKVMRAVYRWLIGFKVVLLALALAAISALYRRRRAVLASCLLLLLILDTVPPMTRRFRQYRGTDRVVRQFYADVIPELRRLVPKGSLIVFVSTENDYLANPISVELEARSYNVGGDKNRALAAARWPAEVKAILQNKDVIAKAKQLHTRGELDYVIFPHFNMRWNSYWWPPNPKQVSALKMAARETLASSDLSGVRVTEGKYATTVGFDGGPPVEIEPPQSKTEDETNNSAALLQ